jgi:hypothetical protein
MPRFYFHLKARVPSEDAEGIELLDVAAARKEAVRFGHELMKVNQGMGQYGSGGDLVVTNEVGDELLTIYLPAPRMPNARNVALASIDPKHCIPPEIEHVGQAHCIPLRASGTLRQSSYSGVPPKASALASRPTIAASRIQSSLVCHPEAEHRSDKRER